MFLKFLYSLMFWKRSSINDKKNESECTQLFWFDKGNSQTQYSNFDIRRSVLDWRDKYTEIIELHLVKKLHVLSISIDKQTQKMSLRDLFSQKRYSKKFIDPIYKDWLRREVSYIIDLSKKDLTAILDHDLHFNEQGNELKHRKSSNNYTDAAISIAATGAGLAAIPVAASLSVVSAGGIAGLFGATAVIVLFVFSKSKMKTMRLKNLSQYRKTIKSTIEEQVLGYHTDKYIDTL